MLGGFGAETWKALLVMVSSWKALCRKRFHFWEALLPSGFDLADDFVKLLLIKNCRLIFGATAALKGISGFLLACTIETKRL